MVQLAFAIAFIVLLIYGFTQPRETGRAIHTFYSAVIGEDDSCGPGVKP